MTGPTPFRHRHLTIARSGSPASLVFNVHETLGARAGVGDLNADYSVPMAEPCNAPDEAEIDTADFATVVDEHYIRV